MDLTPDIRKAYEKIVDESERNIKAVLERHKTVEPVARFMKIALSFTMLFGSIVKGIVKPEQFDQFFFGCIRDHVLCEPQFAPYETTWAQKKKVYEPTLVDLDQLEPETLKAWFQLKAAVLHADSQGRVTWQCCSTGKYDGITYPGIKNALVEDGYNVFYWGEWHGKCWYCGSLGGDSMDVAGDWPRCVNCHGC